MTDQEGSKWGGEDQAGTQEAQGTQEHMQVVIVMTGLGRSRPGGTIYITNEGQLE